MTRNGHVQTVELQDAIAHQQVLVSAQKSLDKGFLYLHNSKHSPANLITLQWIPSLILYHPICICAWLFLEFHSDRIPADLHNKISERKIDQIESRLGNIEGLLRDLSTRNLSAPESCRFANTPQSGASVPTVAPSSVCYDPVTGGYDSSDEESAFGGDSALAAQTTFASEFLENAVERTSPRDVSPRMKDALNNLKRLVEMQNRQSISHGPRFPCQQPVPPGGLGQLKMPPMDIVVSLLRHIRGNPTPNSSNNAVASVVVGINQLISHSCSPKSLHLCLFLCWHLGLLKSMPNGLLSDRRLFRCCLRYCQCRALLHVHRAARLCCR